MKRILLALAFAAVPALGQQPAAPAAPVDELTPKHATAEEELAVSQLDLIVAKRTIISQKAQSIQQQTRATIEPLQEQYSELDRQRTQLIAAIKKDNGWGDDVVLDEQTGKWVRRPKATPPAAATPAAKPAAAATPAPVAK